MKEKLSQFFTQSRQRMARFMAGRNGNDNFNLFLLVCEVVLLLLGSLTGGGMFLPALILLGYIYFRMLSRNVTMRSAENRRFQKVYEPVKNWVQLTYKRIRDRKDYRYLKCPVCKAQLRVKNIKGRHNVRCPKCRSEFEKKI